jgi:hypothetical protein
MAVIGIELRNKPRKRIFLDRIGVVMIGSFLNE